MPPNAIKDIATINKNDPGAFGSENSRKPSVTHVMLVTEQALGPNLSRIKPSTRGPTAQQNEATTNMT